MIKINLKKRFNEFFKPERLVFMAFGEGQKAEQVESKDAMKPGQENDLHQTLEVAVQKTTARVDALKTKLENNSNDPSFQEALAKKGDFQKQFSSIEAKLVELKSNMERGEEEIKRRTLAEINDMLNQFEGPQEPQGKQLSEEPGSMKK